MGGPKLLPELVIGLQVQETKHSNLWHRMFHSGQGDMKAE